MLHNITKDNQHLSEKSDQIVDQKLSLIRFMLSKRKADISFNVIRPAPDRYVANCKIVDLAGRTSVAISDSRKLFIPVGENKRQFVSLQAIETAFTGYMTELTRNMREILEENGLRSSLEPMNVIENAVNQVFAKSLDGVDHGLIVKVGSRTNLNAFIHTTEKEKMGVHIWTQDGITVFKEEGLQVKGAEAIGYAQWLYAVLENAVLTEEKWMREKNELTAFPKVEQKVYSKELYR